MQVNRSAVIMVERPIKKSDRQPIAEPSHTETSPIESNPDTNAQSSEERSVPRPFRGKDKTKAKSKDKEDSRSTPGNPALMRGPKPTKPKPPAIKKAESEGEDAAEETTEDQDGAS